MHRSSKKSKQKKPHRKSRHFLSPINEQESSNQPLAIDAEDSIGAVLPTTSTCEVSLLQLPHEVWLAICGEWLTLRDLSHLDNIILSHEFRSKWLQLLQMIAQYKKDKIMQAQTRSKHQQELNVDTWKLQCNNSKPLIDILKWYKKRKMVGIIRDLALFCPMIHTSLLQDVDRWLPLLTSPCYDSLLTLSLINITIIFDHDLLLLIHNCCKHLQSCKIINCLSLTINTFIELTTYCPCLQSLDYINSGHLFGTFDTNQKNGIFHYNEINQSSFPPRLKLLNIGESQWDMKFMESALSTFRMLESLEVSFLHYHGHDYNSSIDDTDNDNSNTSMNKAYTHYDWTHDSFDDDDNENDDINNLLNKMNKLFNNHHNLLIEKETFHLFHIIKQYSLQLKQLSIHIIKQLINNDMNTTTTTTTTTSMRNSSRKWNRNYSFPCYNNDMTSNIPTSSSFNNDIFACNDNNCKVISSNNHDNSKINQYVKILSYFIPFLHQLEQLIITSYDYNDNDNNITTRIRRHSNNCSNDNIKIELLPNHLICLSKYMMLKEIIAMESSTYHHHNVTTLMNEYNNALQYISHSNMLCLQSLQLGKHITITTETFIEISKGCPNINNLTFKDSLIDNKIFQLLSNYFPKLLTLNIFSTKRVIDNNLLPIFTDLMNQFIHFGIYCPNIGFTGDVFTKLIALELQRNKKMKHIPTNNINNNEITIAYGNKTNEMITTMKLNSINIHSDTFSSQHLQSLIQITPYLVKCLIVAESLSENDVILMIQGWKQLKDVDIQSECKLSNRVLQELINRTKSGIHCQLEAIAFHNPCFFASNMLLNFANKYRLSLRRLHLNLSMPLTRTVSSDLLAVLHSLEDENISDKINTADDIMRLSLRHDSIWIERASKVDPQLVEFTLMECG